jgi:small subunit ribosomal protein S3
MGQKVHPNGIRLGIVKEHSAIWYAGKREYANRLLSDLKIRSFIHKNLKSAQISEIKIKRAANNVEVTIYTAKPGSVLGKKGSELDKLKLALSKIIKTHVHLNIEGVKNPTADSKLVAANVAAQLEKRAAFRRVMKSTMQSVMRSSVVQGVKIKLSGRLGGAEIARSEESHTGRVPLHTFRADIDYASVQALTVYGIIGVKIWIFKGEVHKFNKKD